MAATTPTVTPTIVPVHEVELELVPAPDCCVAFKKLEVVFVTVGVMSVVVLTTVEVGDAGVVTLVNEAVPTVGPVAAVNVVVSVVVEVAVGVEVLVDVLIVGCVIIVVAGTVTVLVVEVVLVVVVVIVVGKVATFNKTDIEFELKLVTAMSGLPSPLKSAAVAP